ncbi:MAG: hypothetical protein AAF195_00405 [Pseudomonadota bacterium]
MTQSDKIKKFSAASYKDVELLLNDYKRRKYEQYDCNNVYFIEDKKDKQIDDSKLLKTDPVNPAYHYKNLEDKLQKLGKLENGTGATFLLRMKFGDDSLDSYSNAVHIRNRGGRLKAFISDSSRGTIGSVLSNANIAQAIANYGDRFYGENNTDLFVDCQLKQKDKENCLVFSFSAMKYLIKHGKELFEHIEHQLESNPGLKTPFILRNGDSLGDNAYYISGKLIPPPLLKLSQYRDLKDARAFYPARIERVATYPSCKNLDLNSFIPENITDPCYEFANEIVSQQYRATLANYRKLGGSNVPFADNINNNSTKGVTYSAAERKGRGYVDRITALRKYEAVLGEVRQRN